MATCHISSYLQYCSFFWNLSQVRVCSRDAPVVNAREWEFNEHQAGARTNDVYATLILARVRYACMSKKK